MPVDINQLHDEVQIIRYRLDDAIQMISDLRQEMSQRISHGEYYSTISRIEQDMKSYNDQVSKLSQEVDNLIEQDWRVEHDN